MAEEKKIGKEEEERKKKELELAKEELEKLEEIEVEKQQTGSRDERIIKEIIEKASISEYGSSYEDLGKKQQQDLIQKPTSKIDQEDLTRLGDYRDAEITSIQEILETYERLEITPAFNAVTYTVDCVIESIPQPSTNLIYALSATSPTQIFTKPTEVFDHDGNTGELSYVYNNYIGLEGGNIDIQIGGDRDAYYELVVREYESTKYYDFEEEKFNEGYSSMVAQMPKSAIASHVVEVPGLVKADLPRDVSSSKIYEIYFSKNTEGNWNTLAQTNYHESLPVERFDAYLSVYWRIYQLGNVETTIRFVKDIVDPDPPKNLLGCTEEFLYNEDGAKIAESGNYNPEATIDDGSCEWEYYEPIDDCKRRYDDGTCADDDEPIVTNNNNDIKIVHPPHADICEGNLGELSDLGGNIRIEVSMDAGPTKELSVRPEIIGGRITKEQINNSMTARASTPMGEIKLVPVEIDDIDLIATVVDNVGYISGYLKLCKTSLSDAQIEILMSSIFTDDLQQALDDKRD